MAYTRRSRAAPRRNTRTSSRVSSGRKRTYSRAAPKRAVAKRNAAPRELRIVIENRGMTSTRPEAAMMVERPPQKAKF